MTKFKILVFTLNKEIPYTNKEFMPVQVGKSVTQLDLNAQGDNEGDNISDKNVNYCELTGVYWAWKNFKDYDYIGLCQYRRYFNFTKNYYTTRDIDFISQSDLGKYEMSLPNVESLMKKFDIILPKPKVYPFNLKVAYCLFHSSKDYHILKQIVHEISPEYDRAFNVAMENNNRLYCYNMFISNKEIFENYCQWVFPILKMLEERIDNSSYGDYQSHVVAYFSERLLTVYITHNSWMKIKHFPVIMVSDESNTYSMIKHKYRDIMNNISFFFAQPGSFFK